jgi:hypothetical protein
MVMTSELFERLTALYKYGQLPTKDADQVEQAVYDAIVAVTKAEQLLDKTEEKYSIKGLTAVA